ncbi:NAD(P)H-dependent flavin oxidoreductase [Guptibacillus algicola]|uniref:NAD(P)H-dependent flavin oxidoreductase n=1 Tax=Guptibacillus algicola TaxID=225844 RepID=UPI001CD2D6B3|nr:nitronate monooxygenase [Alkalihalobacillus algicola]MCA0987403.1 nitronate monooxygenase [Alkalihalobacillus algicola]
MWNHSRLLELLKIDHPIIQAGMAGGVTTPELVAAVSNAGGLGTLGAGYMTPGAMRESIQEINSLTRNSFGVNVFVPEFPNATEEEISRVNQVLDSFRDELGIEDETKLQVDESLFDNQIKVIIEAGVPVCSFTFGIPNQETIKKLKEEGIVLIGTATSVEEAILNEQYGMDAVVAQGSEAGGHRGTFQGSYEGVGSMSLIPQIVDNVSIPVIAAGGIMDGRGVCASMVLGADGAQLGTAFVTCNESGAKTQHKEAILHTKETETVMTSSFSGKQARGIRNAFIEKMEGHERLEYPLQNSLTKGIRTEAAKQNKPEYMSLWSGQSPRLSRSESAAELMQSIVSQAKRINS